MYIPKQFVAKDREEVIAFMRQYNFATLVTAKDNFPRGTHLPFVINERDGKLILTSHYAKANEQWKEVTENQCLVIFNEPHAYISPTHYDKVESVPTWNYLSVHAYGKARLLAGVEESIAVLESMIDSFEASYKQQWDGISDDYKLKMIKGIVAFEIEVTDLQAKKKLSQNKTLAERQRIIETLAHSEHGTEQDLARIMKGNEK